MRLDALSALRYMASRRVVSASRSKIIGSKSVSVSLALCFDTNACKDRNAFTIVLSFRTV